MKRLFVICISAALVSLAGCSDDEDVQPAQKEKIVSFLTGTHAPRLVAEENLEEGSNQPYYTVSAMPYTATSPTSTIPTGSTGRR